MKAPVPFNFMILLSSKRLSRQTNWNSIMNIEIFCSVPNWILKVRLEQLEFPALFKIIMNERDSSLWWCRWHSKQMLQIEMGKQNRLIINKTKCSETWPEKPLNNIVPRESLNGSKKLQIDTQMKSPPEIPLHIIIIKQQFPKSHKQYIVSRPAGRQASI